MKLRKSLNIYYIPTILPTRIFTMSCALSVTELCSTRRLLVWGGKALEIHNQPYNFPVCG